MGGIFSAVTLGVIAAAVTIGGVLWMYGRDLPNHEQLAQYTPPTISRIYSSEGRLMDEFARERRLFTPAQEIPDLVKQAFISAEDGAFYVHAGYDPMGMIKAAIDAAQGKRLRGASTITQQVMKNFLLSSDRSAERKIKEIILASRIEETLDKEAILELYLNEIFLGQNSYGVAAAAQTYFNKTLAEVTLEEAAYLAILPKAPSDYHPVRQAERAIDRRNNLVLREMFENGYITRAEMEEAQAKPLLTVQSGHYQPFRAALPPRDYFTDEIRRQLTRDFGEEEFFTQGFNVRATIDAEMQDVAARALRSALEQYDRSSGIWRGTGKTIPAEALAAEETWREALSKADVARDIDLDSRWHPAVVLDVADQTLTLGAEDVDGTVSVPREDIQWMRGNFFDNFEPGDVVHVRRMTEDASGDLIRWSLRQVPEVQGGFMAMDVNTGRVLAMQGGFSYQHSVFNRATQATRQPGSSFKPFVYAAALDSGYQPNTIVVDAPIEIRAGGEIWRPKNASNRFYGPAPLRTGIERSRNLMTVRLAQDVGMGTVASYAERFGVYDRMDELLANSLGSQETTLYKMVAAYAMFANGGERVEPTLVDRIQDRYGRTVYKHDQRSCEECEQFASLPEGLGPRIVSNRERVMNAITAYQLTSMMKGVVDRGTASKTVNLPVPIAGKTGTTNDAKDVWFVGFSSTIVAGCYIGYDRPRSMGRGASGGGMCGPVFQEFMREAIKKYGAGPFEVPEGGHFVKIDRFTGARLPDDASGPNVVAEYFRDGEDPFIGLGGGTVIDGGFAMAGDLPLFGRGESDDQPASAVQVETSTGRTVVVPGRATFGTLSSGGLY
ncbi:penicillin-binding protein 1A [Jannaschia sp. S6380]|uniref:penicillin-binding protein 1A n=1 Tax=Jannaschia sp. S6380 TaxID=2926408 RepID=UPI001FF43FA4|nr:penicillin-binding protein 1A [Jannaschia sp. S6380]MCK0167076.1 penicillin-binding protein 1A [Jannaschia sp. S6380]